MRQLKIQALLEEICSLLEKYRIAPWVTILKTKKEQFVSARESGDAQKLRAALKAILSIYGGMGSFGDIYVSDKAGFPIAADDVLPVNTKFQDLRTRLYVEVTDEIATLEES